MFDTREEKIKFVAAMLQNHESLNPYLFDDKMMLLEEAKKKFLEIYNFLFDRSLSFFPQVKIVDYVLGGSNCSFAFNNVSDVDLFIFIEDIIPSSPEISNRLLMFINKFTGTLTSRPKFHAQPVDFGVLPSSDERFKGRHYSLINDCWNQVPVRREYSFSAEELFLKYCKYSADLHRFVQNLEKVNNSFLSVESCYRLKDFLSNLRKEAFDAKDNSPEQEYSLDYNLFRLLKKFGVYAHFDNYITDSYKNVVGKHNV